MKVRCEELYTIKLNFNEICILVEALEKAKGTCREMDEPYIPRMLKAIFKIPLVRNFFE